MYQPTRQPQRRRTTFSTPEALENRIAPAAVLPEISSNGKTATWTDVDGDKVTLTITKGTLDAVENFDLESADGVSAILQKLDLTGDEFRGTNITIKAVRGAETGGDNSVNVGFIDATDNILGSVRISGDLAKISAGETLLTKKNATAIKTINVKSMGLLGDTTLNEPGDLVSNVSGNIGSLVVAGSIQGVTLSVTGSEPYGSIGSIKIGGSLIGGDAADSGQISTSGDIGSIVIGGSVEGGRGQSSGVIDVGGDIKSIAITGSIYGGKSEVVGTENSGIVRAEGTIGSVKINGSIEGGTQQRSGLLQAGSDVGNVQVLGSIKGGNAGAFSGGIEIGGNVKSLAVGNITGGAAEQSGFIEIAGTTGNLTVKGTLQGGSALETGFISLGTNASDAVKKITILGSVHGGTGETSGTIRSAGAISDLSISGDLSGGDLVASATESLSESGYIEASAIAKLRISGSIRTGVDYNADPALELLNNGSIRVDNNIGNLTVSGNIQGNADTEVLITARGAVPPLPVNAIKDLAFGSITVGGSVRYAEILAGYNTTADVADAAVNPNAQIGSVTVKKDWIASNLVAGADYNENFGDGSDSKIDGADIPKIFASIAKILIGGQVLGTAETADDHFGFVAEQFGRFQVGTAKYALRPDPNNDNETEELRYNVGGTGDTRIFEYERVPLVK